MNKSLNNTLIPKGRTIFFNEEAHKYTNELGIVYTSVTTIISKYIPEFPKEDLAKACERIGQNPNHPKYLKYKGKKAWMILQEWETITKESCEFGTLKHNFLEDSVKSNNGYKRNATGFIDDRIYTIDDILLKPNFGKINLKTFEKHNINKLYPDIYATLVALTKNGYSIYAEIGVYDDLYGVSGLIDILAVNHKTYEFIIVDWKTNKAPIRFDAGYYGKFEDGRLNLDNWISKEEKFLYPLNHLADSVGHHYTMQLSTYAYLVTTFGFTFKGLILFHIRPIEEIIRPRSQWEEEVKALPIQYFEYDCKLMLDDFKSKSIRQTQMLF